MLRRAKRWLEIVRAPSEELRRAREEVIGKAPVPVFWLFGKVGSGKSSIVRYLTGAAGIAIGTGFRPCTQRSRRYDFPSMEEPLLGFIDTRGLGEVEYDPTEDLAELAARAHVVIVTVRVTDHAQAEVIEPLRRIRAASSSRPVVLALTTLHGAYPGEQHPPYPFAEGLHANGVTPALARCIALQEERFAGLIDHVVPIDFTPPEEGFDEPDYGGEQLKEVLLACLPGAYRSALAALDETLGRLEDLNERRAAPYILGSSFLAATAAAVPLPWIDIPVVTAIQSQLLYRLAALYGARLDTATLLKMAGVVGGRIVTSSLLRASLKLVPFAGSAINAAFAFAYTYALGRVASWYFGEVRAGNVPSSSDLERIFSRELAQAREAWRRAHRAEPVR